MNPMDVQKGKKKKNNKKKNKSNKPVEPAVEPAVEPMEVDEFKEEVSQREYWYLVQYTDTEDFVIHSIVEDRLVFWPGGLPDNPRQVFFKLGVHAKLAHVITRHEDIDYVRKQFAMLKTWCYDMCCIPQDHPQRPNNFNWLLVMYTTFEHNIESMVYTVMNRVRAHPAYKHNCPNSYIYFRKVPGPLVYQAIIVKRDEDYHKINAIFKALQMNCEKLKLPFEPKQIENYGTAFQIPPPNFESLLEASALFEEEKITIEEFNRRMFTEFVIEWNLQKRAGKEIEDIKEIRYVRRYVNAMRRGYY